MSKQTQKCSRKSSMENYNMAYKAKGIASLIIIGVIVVGCTVIAIVSDKYLPADNAIEQIAEAEIKQETGIDVDFSPEKK